MQPVPFLEKQKIKTCFNKAADTYNQNSEIQLKVGRNLIALLMPYLKPKAALVDLGCATGKLSMELADQSECEILIALDIAEKLLAVAKKNCVSAKSICLTEADFDAIPLHKGIIDAVFSNMALQWSGNLATAFQEIQRILTPKGIFAFSIPGKSTFAELSSSQKQINPYLLAHDFISDENLERLLCQKGFQVLEFQSQNYILYFNDLLELVRFIKKSGTSYAPHRQYGSRKYWRDLENYYFKHYRNTYNQLPLTYVIFSVIAQKVSYE